MRTITKDSVLNFREIKQYLKRIAHFFYMITQKRIGGKEQEARILYQLLINERGFDTEKDCLNFLAERSGLDGLFKKSIREALGVFLCRRDSIRELEK